MDRLTTLGELLLGDLIPENRERKAVRLEAELSRTQDTIRYNPLGRKRFEDYAPAYER